MQYKLLNYYVEKKIDNKFSIYIKKQPTKEQKFLFCYCVQRCVFSILISTFLDFTWKILSINEKFYD